MSQRASRKAKTAAADFFKRIISGRDTSVEPVSPKAKQKSSEPKQAKKPSETRSTTRSLQQNKDDPQSSVPAQGSPRAKAVARTKASEPTQTAKKPCKDKAESKTNKSTIKNASVEVPDKPKVSRAKRSDTKPTESSLATEAGPPPAKKPAKGTGGVSQGVGKEKGPGMVVPNSKNEESSQLTAAENQNTVLKSAAVKGKATSVKQNTIAKNTAKTSKAGKEKKPPVTGTSNQKKASQATRVDKKAVTKPQAEKLGPKSGDSNDSSCANAAVLSGSSGKASNRSPVAVVLQGAGSSVPVVKLSPCSPQHGPSSPTGHSNICKPVTPNPPSQTKSLLSSLKKKEKPRPSLLPAGRKSLDTSPPPVLSPKASPKQHLGSPKAKLLLNTLSPKSSVCRSPGHQSPPRLSLVEGIIPSLEDVEREMPLLHPECDPPEREEEEEETKIRWVAKGPLVLPDVPDVFPKNIPLEHPTDIFSQAQFIAIFGLINKSELKIVTGLENKLHRTAGGRLRRTIKPRICPEMVSDYVLTKSGAVKGVPGDWGNTSSSGSSDEDGEAKPKVANKVKILETEQNKKLRLSPKIHTSYSKHCDRVPVISLDKYGKSQSAPSTPERRALLGQGKRMTIATLDKLKSLKNESSNTQRKLDFIVEEAKVNKKPLLKPAVLSRQTSDPGQPGKIAKQDCSNKILKDVKPVKPNKPLESKCLDAKSKALLSKMKGIDVKSKAALLSKMKASGQLKKPLMLQNKSKSFDDRTGKANLLQIKSKSFSGKGAGEPPKMTRSRSALEEVDDGTRRSARQRGSKRKEWWHLLRANPDEFEEDEEWEEEQAEKERKKTEREERRELERLVALEEEEEAAMAVQEEEDKKHKQCPEPGEKEVSSSEMATSKQTSVTGKGLKRKASDGALCSDGKKCKTEGNCGNESPKGTDGCPLVKKKKKKKKRVCDGPPDPDSLLMTSVGGQHKAFHILDMDAKPMTARDNCSLFASLREILPQVARDTEKLLQLGYLEFPLKSGGRPQPAVGLLGYSSKEGQCITPHMCPICWINDHMYCRNMRRTARDLVPNGGCIHYIPCPHYRKVCQSKYSPHRQPGSASLSPYSVSNPALDSGSTSLTIRDGLMLCQRPTSSPKTDSTMENQRPTSLPSCVTPKPMVATGKPPEKPEDLFCHEQLVESDPEPNSPPTPAGTEALRVQLKARAMHLARSMGVKESDLHTYAADLKHTWTGFNAAVELFPEDTVDNLHLEPEEYGAEVNLGDDEEEEEDIVKILLKDTQVQPVEMEVDKPEDDIKPDMEAKEEICLRLVPYQSKSQESKVLELDGKQHHYMKLKVQKVLSRNLQLPAQVDDLAEVKNVSWNPETEDKNKSTSIGQGLLKKKKKKKKAVPKTESASAKVPDADEESNASSQTLTSDVLEPSQDSQDTLVSDRSSVSELSSKTASSTWSTADSCSDHSEEDSDQAEESIASLDICLSEDGSSKPVLSGAPIQITSRVTNIPDNLRKEVTSSNDGSQMLQFSTKDIREHKPELLAYIRRAGLVDVIARTLSQEKTTLLKLIHEGEEQLEELKDSLEQNRCLLMAVQSEVKSVKDQILSVQKTMLQDESQAVRLRKHVSRLDSQHEAARKCILMCNAGLKYLGVQEEDRPEGTESTEVEEEEQLSEGQDEGQEIRDVDAEEETGEEIPDDEMSNETLQREIVNEVSEHDVEYVTADQEIKEESMEEPDNKAILGTKSVLLVGQEEEKSVDEEEDDETGEAGHQIPPQVVLDYAVDEEKPGQAAAYGYKEASLELVEDQTDVEQHKDNRHQVEMSEPATDPVDEEYEEEASEVTTDPAGEEYQKETSELAAGLADVEHLHKDAVYQEQTNQETQEDNDTLASLELAVAEPSHVISGSQDVVYALMHGQFVGDAAPGQDESIHQSDGVSKPAELRIGTNYSCTSSGQDGAFSVSMGGVDDADVVTDDSSVHKMQISHGSQEVSSIEMEITDEELADTEVIDVVVTEVPVGDGESGFTTVTHLLVTDTEMNAEDMEIETSTPLDTNMTQMHMQQNHSEDIAVETESNNSENENTPAGQVVDDVPEGNVSGPGITCNGSTEQAFQGNDEVNSEPCSPGMMIMREQIHVAEEAVNEPTQSTSPVDGVPDLIEPFTYDQEATSTVASESVGTQVLGSVDDMVSVEDMSQVNASVIDSEVGLTIHQWPELSTAGSPQGIDYSSLNLAGLAQMPGHTLQLVHITNEDSETSPGLELDGAISLEVVMADDEGVLDRESSPHTQTLVVTSQTVSPTQTRNEAESDMSTANQTLLKVEDLPQPSNPQTLPVLTTDLQQASQLTPVSLSQDLDSPSMETVVLMDMPHIDYPSNFSLMGGSSLEEEEYASVIVEQEPSGKADSTLTMAEDSGLGSSQETTDSVF